MSSAFPVPAAAPTPSGRTEEGGAPRTFPALPFLLALFALVVSSTSIDPNDTWWHIKSGEYYLQHHVVPSTDVFSHTAGGHTYFAHEWLSQVILYLIYRGFGFVGIRVLNSLMAMVAMLLLYRFYAKSGARLLPLLFGIALIFPDVLGRMNTRPEIFTLPLTIGFMDFILHRDRSRRPTLRAVLIVAGLAALWANLHGMALLGLLFYGAWLAGQATTLWMRRWVRVPEWGGLTAAGLIPDLVLFAVYAVAVMASPLGYRIYVHAWEGRHFLPGPLGIMEWLSPFQFLGSILHSFLTQSFPWINVALGWEFLFLAVPLACCFALPVLAARRHLPTLGETFVVLLAIYEAAAAVRFRWLFFIPIYWLLEAMSEDPRRPAAESRVSTRTLVLQPVLILVIAFGSYMMLSRGITFRRAINTGNYPVGIANFLTDLGIGGNLFNTYNWGGYLIFRLAPAYRVFIDGRTDLYALSSRNLLLDHVTIDTKQQGYQELLDAYHVDVLTAANHIYFPGPEIIEETRFTLEQRREQMIRGSSAEPALLSSSGSLDPSPEVADPLDTTLWVPLLISNEGSVYLRNTPSHAARLAAVTAFFARHGVPFSVSGGPDLAALIRDHPRLAVRWGVLPEDLVRGLLTTASNPGSDEAIRQRIELAGIFDDLELYRDGVAILERVLREDHYNNEALMRIGVAEHLLGNDRAASMYFDRSAAVGRNASAAVWLRHCQVHHLPPSDRPARLPPLPTLLRSWAAAL